MRAHVFEGVEDVVRGASEYPIWRRNSMAFEEAAHADDGIEALPDAASAADRALAAVATIACDMPLTLMSSASTSQVHSDQSALKLALAIKNLADGMHHLERRQADADTIIGTLKQEVRSVEERTISLKSEQMAVVTTVKRALRTTQQQSDYLEVQKCIVPQAAASLTRRNLPAPGPASINIEERIEERLQQVEEQVAALLQWQEDEAAKGIEQIVGRGPGDRATEDLKQAVQMNCGLLKTLHQSVSQLEESGGSKASDQMAVNEVRHLHRHMQETYYSRRELTPLLEDLEAKINSRLREDYVQRVAPHPQGGDALAALAATGHGADRSGRLRGFEARMERNEARIDKNMLDLQDRLDPIQDFVDQQRLATWQANRQMPEVGQKLDQLWAQCQYFFSKVKEHDVHFGFFRNSFESHKQHCLDLGDFEHSNGKRSASNGVRHSTWDSPLVARNEDERVISIGATQAAAAEPLPGSTFGHAAPSVASR